MRRITGASLKGRRPAQMSTSAWRGENAWRSIPKRAKSKRLAAVAMNSMAQHAVPNGMGQSELARDQFTSLSTRVTRSAHRTNSSNRVVSQLGLAATSFVSRTCFMKRTSSRKDVEEDGVEGNRPGTQSTVLLDAVPRRRTLDASIPLQGPPLPDVDVSDREDQHEHQHLAEQEAHARASPPGRPAPVARPPRDAKPRLQIDHEAQHRDEVEFDGEALVRVAQGGHAALVRHVL